MSASLLLELAPPFFALFIELISFPKDRFLEHAAERLLDDEEVEPYVIKDRPGETHIRHRLTSKIADTCRGSVCFYSIAPTLIAVVATLETLKSEWWVIAGLIYTIAMIVFFVSLFTGQPLHEMEDDVSWIRFYPISYAQLVRYWIILTNASLIVILFHFRI